MKKQLQKLKVLTKILLGREPYIKLDIGIPSERVGSVYGGWHIAPTKINSSSIVYSFGVGEDISFDLAMIKKFDLNIHAFDPTPKCIDWLSQQDLPDNFKMHEYGIASFDGEISFNPPENPDHVSHTILERPSTSKNAISVPVKKLATIIQELGHEKIDILKMDIEGAEYDVIEDIMASDIRPDQIFIEFHHGFPNVEVSKTKAAVSQIRSMGYKVFYVAESNKEYSFIKCS